MLIAIKNWFPNLIKVLLAENFFSLFLNGNRLEDSFMSFAFTVTNITILFHLIPIRLLQDWRILLLHLLLPFLSSLSNGHYRHNYFCPSRHQFYVPADIRFVNLLFVFPTQVGKYVFNKSASSMEQLLYSSGYSKSPCW